MFGHCLHLYLVLVNGLYNMDVNTQCKQHRDQHVYNTLSITTLGQFSHSPKEAACNRQFPSPLVAKGNKL